MKDDLEKVKMGYFRLSEEDKKELVKFIHDIDESEALKAEYFVKAIDALTKRSLGPKDSSSCPCCHK